MWFLACCYVVSDVAIITQACFISYLMVFSHSWRCSHAFLTSMLFNKAKVPMVRWSFAGFWKTLSSTPWSYKLDYTDKSMLNSRKKNLVVVWHLCASACQGGKRENVGDDVTCTLTCEHCCNTSSLKFKNPSWIWGWFKGNDKKCVKGCFFRKLSTRTSTRVTAEDTAALWKPVMTVRQTQWTLLDVLSLVFHWFSPICPSTPCFGMLMDVLVSDSRRLRVSPFLPMMYLQDRKVNTETRGLVQRKRCMMTMTRHTCKGHLGHRWHSGTLYLSVPSRERHKSHHPQSLGSLKTECSIKDDIIVSIGSEEWTDDI